MLNQTKDIAWLLKFKQTETTEEVIKKKRLKNTFFDCSLNDKSNHRLPNCWAD